MSAQRPNWMQRRPRAGGNQQQQGKPQANRTTTPKTTKPAAMIVVDRAKDYPKSFLEASYHAIFGDPDLKWGVFHAHVRQARKEDRWVEWSMRDIAEKVPDDADPSRKNENVTPQAHRHYRFAEEVNRWVAPARIDFNDLLQRRSHPADYDDDFYKLHFGNLYDKTVEFATKWFDGGINYRRVAPDIGIWDTNLPPQFINYAIEVAHEDPGHSSWAAMMNDPTQRRWLVIGILGKIMQKKIFNELLFGADPNLAQELERDDLLYADKEGYHRKQQRLIKIRWSLGERRSALIPSNFWNEVDDLAARVTEIFLPLLNMLQLSMPDSKTWFKPEMFLCELHYILAYAGMFQVCTAISPSIFKYIFATPSARMDYNQESQADMGLYSQSLEAHTKKDKASIEYMRRSVAGQPVGDAPKDVGTKVPKTLAELAIEEHHRIRGAKVKIAIFPKLTRYTPRHKNKGLPPEPTAEQYRDRNFMQKFMDDNVDEMEGQIISEISDCMVVYYQGRMYPRDGNEGALMLNCHLNRRVRKTNGLLALVGWLIKSLFMLARRLFWHLAVLTISIAVIAGVSWLLTKLYSELDIYMIFSYIWFWGWACVLPITAIATSFLPMDKLTKGLLILGAFGSQVIWAMVYRQSLTAALLADNLNNLGNAAQPSPNLADNLGGVFGQNLGGDLGGISNDPDILSGLS